jgi:hypothetical protein
LARIITPICECSNGLSLQLLITFAAAPTLPVVDYPIGHTHNDSVVLGVHSSFFSSAYASLSYKCNCNHVLIHKQKVLSSTFVVSSHELDLRD